MALVCTMSVFNGFQDLVASFFTAIDPQLKVTPSQGKTMAADDPRLTALKTYPGIKIYTETLEDHALVICGEHQAMVTIKGVDDNFAQMADLNNCFTETVRSLYMPMYWNSAYWAYNWLRN